MRTYVSPIDGISDRMKTFVYLVLLIVCSCMAAGAAVAGIPVAHPNIVLTTRDAALIRASLGRYPLFDAQYNELKSSVDKAIAQPIDVPIPVDAAGYTHGRHKQNYKDMYGAGLLYSITGEARYASFVRTMLLRYAMVYPTWLVLTQMQQKLQERVRC